MPELLNPSTAVPTALKTFTARVGGTRVRPNEKICNTPHGTVHTRPRNLARAHGTKSSERSNEVPPSTLPFSGNSVPDRPVCCRAYNSAISPIKTRASARPSATGEQARGRWLALAPPSHENSPQRVTNTKNKNTPVTPSLCLPPRNGL